LLDTRRDRSREMSSLILIIFLLAYNSDKPYTVRMMTVYDSPEKISMYRLKVLRSAMKLELLGMKKKGRSVFHIVREEFGFSGNRAKVFEDFSNFLLDLEQETK
jgi:hypothetical protein